MCIDYFLFAKDKHEAICLYLNLIINIYDDLINETKLQNPNEGLYNKDEDIKLFERIKQDYEDHLHQTTHFYKTIQELTNAWCKHEYIIDLIDITLDKSVSIEYCQICGHTK